MSREVKGVEPDRYDEANQMKEPSDIAGPNFWLSPRRDTEAKIHVPANYPGWQLSKGRVDVDVATAWEGHSRRELCIDESCQ